MGKKQISDVFQAKIAAGEKLFIPYIMAGDGEGGLENLEERLTLLQDAGASAVELGIPFSDPVADGPTIQAAGLRARQNGTTLTRVLETVKGFNQQINMPIIIMTYLNPILSYGISTFAEDCASAGIDGVIIPDLPLEEEAMITDDLQKQQIALIRLAALTSPADRLQQIAERTEGFLYAVSVKGTTGARSTHAKDVNDYLHQLTTMTDVPVLAGFGVSTSEQAHDLGSACHGVVVGSRIVDLFAKGDHDSIQELIKQSVTANVSNS